MRRNLIKIYDPDGEYWYVDYEDMADLSENPQTSTDISLKQLADFCDRNAESDNNHTYVGTHRILASLLHRRLGQDQATTIMREIAEYGGLDGMAGVGGKPDTFADFGIKDCWADWEPAAKNEGKNNH